MFCPKIAIFFGLLGVKMSFFERLSEQLERDFGQFPGPKSDLLAWVDDQVTRCTRLGVPGDAALSMVNAGYVELRAQLLTPDVSFGAMPGLKSPADFDQDDSEIQQLFHGN
jgi:hypothetical protein